MKVTLQQAANNAFASWLAGKMVDIPVEARWPSPDREDLGNCVSVVLAGARQDTALDPKLLKSTNVGGTQARSVWQVAACDQPIQLDVWATSDAERDDILARLDDFLHADQSSLASSFCPTPAGNGCLIALADGWEDCGTIADFLFENPDSDDTSDDAGRSIYRATFRGTAHMMLTVTATTARQVAINFALRLAETDGSFTAFP